LEAALAAGAVSLSTVSRPVEVMVREAVSMGSQLGALVLVTLQHGRQQSRQAGSGVKGGTRACLAGCADVGCVR
jgi:hypothetical protein